VKKTILDISRKSAWLALLGLPFLGIKWALITGSGIFAALAIYSAASRGGAGAAVAATGHAIDRLTSLAMSRKTATGVAFAALLIALPITLNDYFIDVLNVTGIYIILALGLNLVVGMTGMLHLGYVAFYAVGAYTFGLLSVKLGVSFWLALPAGALISAAFGILLGLPTLRLRGDYLAIVTLGFGEMIRITLNNWDSFTGGPNGVMNIARPTFAGIVLRSPVHFYYLILVLAAVAAIAVTRLNNSPLGRALVAVREDEAAAESLGINVTRMKILAFSMGAFWAGMAGVIFASKQTFVSPESFNFMESVLILCMVVLGGMGSIPGVIVGACILYLLPEGLRQFQLYRMLIFGAVLVMMMIFRPQGLIPSTRRKIELEEREE
jgi:branched-chain amino acid transport system permease protein